MSVEYWRDSMTDRVVVVEIDDATDTVQVTAPVLRRLLEKAGFDHTLEWRGES